MKVGIVSDHRGFLLKGEISTYLRDNGYEVMDYGSKLEAEVDFPDYAFLLGQAIVNKKVEVGVAFCGTGIGMAIASNKVKGIRCAKVSTKEEAKQARLHLDANMIALSANHDIELIKEIILLFLKTNFSNLERYQKRINKIEEYEGVIK